MTKTLNLLITGCALLFAATGLHVSLGAQATSAADGIYADAQAKRGAALYAEQCASCHGETLGGVADLFPALAGDAFVTTWQGKSVGDLFEKISTTMPALDPGSLKPEQNADLVAYILSVSKYPAGAADLATGIEPLKQVKIGAPKK